VSTQAAVRRRAAGIVATVVAAAALAIIPLNLGAANATVTPNVAALQLLNEDRVDGSGDPAFLTNGFLDDFAQSLATNFGNCGGCGDPTTPTKPLGGGVNLTYTSNYAYAVAAGGTVAGRPARVVNDFETFNSSISLGTAVYGSIGFYTKGTTSYAVLVTASFPSTPTDETRPGTVKLPAKIHVGQAIIPSITGFNPLPTTDYGYTWLDGASTVSHVRFYVPTANDFGHQLKLIVEDHPNGFSDLDVTSALSTKVLIGSATGPTSIPVEGARNVGEPLSVNTNGWTPVQPTIQWYRNGVKIAGQTADTYMQTSADRGTKISLKLTDTAAGFVGLTRSSSTTIVTGYPLLTSAPYPTITGSPSFGFTLTANTGDWGPGLVKLTYQWRAEGTAIPGATKSTLLLGGAELNSSITVTITGTEAGYAVASRTSSATTDIHLLGFSAMTSPTLNGVFTPGHTITATLAPWSPVATLYVYQWYLNDVAVSGANKSSYKLPSNSAGKDVKVNVIGMRPDYQPQQFASSNYLILAP
jgi:hypothetical protein